MAWDTARQGDIFAPPGPVPATAAVKPEYLFGRLKRGHSQQSTFKAYFIIRPPWAGF